MRTQEAINHFGSAAKLAERLGIGPSAVSQWGAYPPMRRQYELQWLTKNKLRVTKPEAQ